MKRFGAAVAILAGSAAIVAAQQPTPADVEMSKTWSMTLNTDKLTDAKVFTATATAHADENPAHVYQLTIKCNGKPLDLSLSAWDVTGAPAGMMNPRSMAWQSSTVTTGGEVTARAGNTNGPPIRFAPIVQNEVNVPNAVQVRVDTATVFMSRLDRVSDNEGSLPPDIFIPNTTRMDSGGTLSTELEYSLGRVRALRDGDALPLMMPKSRLLIGNVFANETVEFTFSTLTPDARSAFQNMCGFDRAAAPSEVKPRLLRQVPPQYTAAATKARIEGTVGLECVVRADGTVGDVRVIRSLDSRLGLDEEAIRAMRQWRFLPGTKNGVPVDMTVTIDLAFSLRR